MDHSKIEVLGKELAKDLKTSEDLSQFSALLKKVVVEAALSAEMDDHLGYEPHSPEGYNTGNSRNGKSRKHLKGDHGDCEISVPRDRAGTFEPQLIKKHQTRITGMDDQILSLYAKGLSTRDITATFKEMYDVDVSPSLISKVTDAVYAQVLEWQNRPLDPIYPIVYLDGIVVKIRQDKRVINKTIYLALGVNLEGKKELLGMWIAETEGAKFWLNVMTELKNRGLTEILIACMDGLKGFPDAVNTVYPKAKIQLCIVHMVRNSLKFVPWKDYKAVTTDLKAIYKSMTEAEALSALDTFAEKWDDKYPQISRSWRQNWPNIITFFDYPDDIRKVIYTTNAIESLNSVIRKAVNRRKLFPNDDAAFKVVFLVVDAASKKWTMPIRHWKEALNRFAIEFDEQITPYL